MGKESTHVCGHPCFYFYIRLPWPEIKIEIYSLIYEDHIVELSGYLIQNFLYGNRSKTGSFSSCL